MNQADIDAAVQSLGGHGTFPASKRWVEALEISRRERAFHWELEFPEVFFELNGDPSPEAGFDAVIGNPPYEVLETRKGDFASPGGMTSDDKKRYSARKNQLDLHRAYFRGGGFPRETSGGKLDLFRLFIERNLSLVREEQHH